MSAKQPIVPYPSEYCEIQAGAAAPEMRSECLVMGPGMATVEGKVRFLQLAAPRDRQEGLERDICTPACALELREREPCLDGHKRLICWSVDGNGILSGYADDTVGVAADLPQAALGEQIRAARIIPMSEGMPWPPFRTGMLYNTNWAPHAE